MELRTLEYNGKTYEYSVRKNARAKRVRVSIEAGGAIRVTKPIRVPLYMVDVFVKSQAAWISSHADSRIKSAAQIPAVPSYKESKERARALITSRVKHFAPLYGKTVTKIAIRNQKTRWGSCSSNGTLSFNYHLLFLSPELLDYVVVHEICHMLAPNHSPKFWKLVVEQVPEHRKLRAELRKHPFS